MDVTDPFAVNGFVKLPDGSRAPGVYRLYSESDVNEADGKKDTDLFKDELDDVEEWPCLSVLRMLHRPVFGRLRNKQGRRPGEKGSVTIGKQWGGRMISSIVETTTCSCMFKLCPAKAKAVFTESTSKSEPRRIHLFVLHLTDAGLAMVTPEIKDGEKHCDVTEAMKDESANLQEALLRLGATVVREKVFQPPAGKDYGCCDDVEHGKRVRVAVDAKIPVVAALKALQADREVCKYTLRDWQMKTRIECVAQAELEVSCESGSAGSSCGDGDKDRLSSGISDSQFVFLLAIYLQFYCGIAFKQGPNVYDKRHKFYGDNAATEMVYSLTLPCTLSPPQGSKPRTGSGSERGGRTLGCLVSNYLYMTRTAEGEYECHLSLCVPSSHCHGGSSISVEQSIKLSKTIVHGDSLNVATILGSVVGLRGAMARRAGAAVGIAAGVPDPFPLSQGDNIARSLSGLRAKQIGASKDIDAVLQHLQTNYPNGIFEKIDRVEGEVRPDPDPYPNEPDCVLLAFFIAFALFVQAMHIGLDATHVMRGRIQKSGGQRELYLVTITGLDGEVVLSVSFLTLHNIAKSIAAALLLLKTRLAERGFIWRDPEVFFVDDYVAEHNAIRMVFKESKIIVCSWHFGNRLEIHAKRAFSKDTVEIILRHYWAIIRALRTPHGIAQIKRSFTEIFRLCDGMDMVEEMEAVVDEKIRMPLFEQKLLENATAILKAKGREFASPENMKAVCIEGQLASAKARSAFASKPRSTRDLQAAVNSKRASIADTADNHDDELEQVALIVTDVDTSEAANAPGEIVQGESNRRPRSERIRQQQLHRGEYECESCGKVFGTKPERIIHQEANCKPIEEVLEKIENGGDADDLPSDGMYFGCITELRCFEKRCLGFRCN